MAARYAIGDSIGLYYTGDRFSSDAFSLAGCRGKSLLKKRVYSRTFLVNPQQQIPQLIIEGLGGGNALGEGVLTATGASTLTWKAPGSATVGTEITIADGETHTLADGESDDAWITVTRDGTDDLVGTMALDILPVHGGAVAGADVTIAQNTSGHNFYHALGAYNPSSVEATSVTVRIKTLSASVTTDVAQLGASGAGTITTSGNLDTAEFPQSGWARVVTNGGTLREIVYYSSRTATSLTISAAGHRARLGTTAAAGAADDTVIAIPGIRFALEATSGGVIQEIADQETAPTGVSWSTAIVATSIGTLAADGWHGVWVHREIPSGISATPSLTSGLILEWTQTPNSYEETYQASYAAQIAAQWRIFTGEDAQPDPTGTPFATDAALPITTGAITPPGSGSAEFQVLVRYRNVYGVESVNWRTFKFDIDAAGDDVTPEVSAPVNVALENNSGGYLILQAEYIPNATPADTWLYWITTNGVDPDPDVDLPTERAMFFGSAAAYLGLTLGPYLYNTDVRVLLRAYRSSDAAVSANTTVLQATVNTTAVLSPVPGRYGFRGDAFGQQHDPTVRSGEEVFDVTEDVKVEYANGRSLFYVDTTLLWGLFWSGDDSDSAKFYMPSNVLALKNTAHSAAGTDDPIEVVSATEIYICVAGIRRAKIDLSTGYLEADGFTGPAAMDSDYLYNSPVWQRGDAVVFGVWDAWSETWAGVLKVDNAGMVTWAAAVDQTLTQAQIEAL